jgi:hypothetical protein
MISLEAIVVQDSEPVTATIDDEVVMLSVSAGAYFGLNGIGSEIWNRLREPKRISDLCKELANQYEGDRETISRDVASFVQALLERGLLRLVPTVPLP